MVREQRTFNHSNTVNKESPVAKIVSRKVKGDSQYEERLLAFKSLLSQELSKDPSIAKEALVSKVVELALLNEFSEDIKNFVAYDHMKDTIASALLRDGDLEEKILGLAVKYQKTESH